MVSKVLCVLADGLEEIELIAPVDILRRAGVEVVMATPSGSVEVRGKMGVRIGADAGLSGLDTDNFDALLLPGGPAVMELRESGEITSLARSFWNARKVIAAICGAPLLLHDAGLLAGKRHTGHFSTRGELRGVETDERVIVDGQIVTSRGAGTAIEFGLALASLLAGEEVAARVAADIMA